ncbi:hypothetical protein [Yersinia mollaretii]|uniref:hypothetical protein n=1 Tax=Yersinia mollaretii TaxID=33060 RepID=UPI0011A11FFA|nr:hypothetical protein [Yersinia mollaretii]
MKKFLLVASVVLAGCASSPQKLKSQPPYADFKSTKTVNDLTSCISSKLEERSYGLSPLQTFIKPVAHGQAITTVGNAEIIEVKQQGQNSKINYYSVFPGRLGANQDRVDGIKSDIESWGFDQQRKVRTDQPESGGHLVQNGQ